MNKKNNNNNPFVGILVGIVFIIIGTVILWHNESNNVKNIKTVNDITKNAIEVSNDEIDPSNDGKLVIVKGKLVTKDAGLTDAEFNVSVKTPKMRRVVEMYQWKEEKEENDDNTTYSYDKVWSDDVIDSSSFHDQGYTNPTDMPLHDLDFVAGSVSLGAFDLSDDQKNNLNCDETVNLNESNVKDGYSLSGNYLTDSADLNDPQIGDIRIYYLYNNYENVTVMAQQSGNTFVNYVNSYGKTVNRVEKGLLSKKELTNMMTKENNFIKWVMRFVGTIFIILGYTLLASPLTSVLSFIPLFGNLAGNLINSVLALIGLIHSLLVISISWLVYRPLISIILIIIIAGLIYLIIRLVNKNKSNKNQSVNGVNQVNTNQSVSNLNSGQPLNTNQNSGQQTSNNNELK